MTRIHGGGWLAAALALLLAGDAVAQDTVSQWAYRRLSKSHEALSAGKYTEAHLPNPSKRNNRSDPERGIS